MNHAVVAVMLSAALFSIIHSITASFACKRLAESCGLTPLLYRRLYVVGSLLLMIVWLLWLDTLPDARLFSVDGVGSVVMRAMQALGLVVAIAAFYPIDTAAFLGFRPQPCGDPFVVRGIYRYIRHPMYAGLMLMLLAQPEQTINHAVLSLMLCFYCLIGARLEEARMIAWHPEYAEYRRQTAAWLPGFSFNKFSFNK